MNRKRFIHLVGVLALAILSSAPFLSRPSKEPHYQGKTVGQWIDSLELYSDIGTNCEFRAMLSELGSNAVPPLMKEFRRFESGQTRLLQRIQTSPSFPRFMATIAQARLGKSWWRVSHAFTSLIYLEKDALCAVPQLEQIVCGSESNVETTFAIQLLEMMDLDGWRALARLSTNAPAATRPEIQSSIDRTWKRALASAEPKRRGEAALVLCHLNSTPHLVIPELVDMINSDDAAKQERALYSLAKLAPEYLTARDAIKQATKSDQPEVRSLAQSILDSTNRINTAAKR